MAATDVDFYNNSCNGLNYSSMVSTSARNEEKSSRRLVIMQFLINFLNRIRRSFVLVVVESVGPAAILLWFVAPVLTYARLTSPPSRVHHDELDSSAQTAAPRRRPCGVGIRAASRSAMHVVCTTSCTTSTGQWRWKRTSSNSESANQRAPKSMITTRTPARQDQVWQLRSPFQLWSFY